jgi:hypothetical protein
MGAVYLRYPDGQMTQQAEDAVRSLWSQRLLPNGATYWKEGMPDWRPLTEWLGQQAPLEPSETLPEPETAGHTYHFLIDPALLTRLLQRLLWIGAALACVAFIIDSFEFIQVRLGHLSLDQLSGDDPVQNFIGLLQSFVAVATGITFLKWIYIAYKNTKGFGAEGLRYSPGWAVGYYFIPILSLVRPVQVMSEIWRVSENPHDWRQRAGSWLIGAWWALFLVYSIATQIALRIAIEYSIAGKLSLANWSLASGFAIVADAAAIPLSLVMLRLITRIYERQRNLVESGHSESGLSA